MDRGAAAVHGVARKESNTGDGFPHERFRTHALQKEMATSLSLAWRNPRREVGGSCHLMRSHRVGLTGRVT